jgi:hypothetical protein
MKLLSLPTLFLLALPALHAAPVLRINGKVSGDTTDTASLAKDPLPTWIWGAENNRNQFLRCSFEVKGAPVSARLLATCDNVMTVWINGQEVAKSGEWQKPVSVDVLKSLKPDGKNLIAVKAENQDAGAGFILKLVLTSADGTETTEMTGDAGWKVSDQETASWQEAAFDDSAWQQPKVIGKYGTAPWGSPSAGAGVAALAPSASSYSTPSPAAMKAHGSPSRKTPRATSSHPTRETKACSAFPSKTPPISPM